MRVLLVPDELSLPWGEEYLRASITLGRFPDRLLYCGWRPGGEPVVYRIEEHGTDAPLTATPLEHHVVHSPTGFEWGYEGSGPADLAYNLVLDYVRWCLAVRGTQAGEQERTKLAQHLASEVHQTVKLALVAALPRDKWLLPGWGMRICLQPMLRRGRARGGWLTPTSLEALELAVGPERKGGPRKAAAR